MVTGIVIVCPGSTTYGVAAVVGSMLASQRSPVGELTARSKPAVVAPIEVTAVTGLTPSGGVGPFWKGASDQIPDATEDEEKLP
jgi:hypothetical protein